MELPKHKNYILYWSKSCQSIIIVCTIYLYATKHYRICGFTTGGFNVWFESLRQEKRIVVVVNSVTPIEMMIVFSDEFTDWIGTLSPDGSRSHELHLGELRTDHDVYLQAFEAQILIYCLIISSSLQVWLRTWWSLTIPIRGNVCFSWFLLTVFALITILIIASCCLIQSGCHDSCYCCL